MTDAIVQLLDSEIGSYSDSSDEAMDLSLLTQANHPEQTDADLDRPDFLDALFQRADNIVRSTPSSSKTVNAKEIQVSRIKHQLVKLAMENAKTTKNLGNLQQQIKAGRCPQSLRFKASPRLKRDDVFNAAFKLLVNESQQKLLALLTQQHERNISLTRSKMAKQYKELETLCGQNKNRLAEAKRDIANAISSSSGSAGKKTNTVKAKTGKPNDLCKTLRFVSPKKRSRTVKVDEKEDENKVFEIYQRSRLIATRTSTQQRTLYKPITRSSPRDNNNTFKREQTHKVTPKSPSTLSQKRKLRRQNYNLAMSAQRNSRFIRNLSDQGVSHAATNLIAKGLKFIPTPLNRLSIHTLLRDFKGFQNRMRWSYIFSRCEPKPIHPFYVKSNKDAPPVASKIVESFLDNVRKDIAKTRFHKTMDNLRPEEREALKILSRDKEIILKKADKGSTTVLMNKAGKIQEGLDLLNNPLHYAVLPEPMVEDTYEKAMDIVSRLRASRHIDEMTFRYLRQKENEHVRIPEFYTLTKIHKQTPVGRPITSGCGGPTERISQFVDFLLQPIAQTQSSYIKDTTDFINFIESTVVPNDVLLVTMDVTSLYTNIPAEEGIEFVTKSYSDFYGERPPIPTEYLKELLSLILKENSFRFNGQHFLQQHGVAMGTKTAVSFANIYMANLEKKILAESPVKPLHYKRFIDDVGSLFLCSRVEMTTFENFVNSFHPTIKFTLTISDSQMIFLDTIIFKGPRLEETGLLDVRTYFKPTETFQYTHFTSSHPISCKKGFVKGEALRYLRNNSIEDYFAADIANFRHRLADRGYPPTLVDPILEGVKFADRKKALQRSTQQHHGRTPIMVTTFDPRVPPLKPIIMKHWHLIQDHTRLSRIFPEEPIVAHRRTKSLGDVLVRAKIV